MYNDVFRNTELKSFANIYYTYDNQFRPQVYVITRRLHIETKYHEVGDTFFMCLMYFNLFLK
jgi:hypothetical protein